VNLDVGTFDNNFYSILSLNASQESLKSAEGKEVN
jgi:hypothetical protein